MPSQDKYGQPTGPQQAGSGGGNIDPRLSGQGGDVDSFGISGQNGGGNGILFNPNTQQGTAVANAISPFLQALFSNPQSFMQGMGGFASPLQQGAVGNIQSFLNQPAPETRALGQAMPAIQGLLGGQGAQNPFGGFSAGQQTVNAAQPVFQQNLQTALTGVANRAPSVRNSAFGDQSSGLAQRALSDFNLFQQQALQQGQQLDANFALGSAGLAQQGQLGGLSALGSLSQAAGQNPFQRMLGAGQLGGQFTQGMMNPLLQLMMGGMQFGQQNPLELAIRNPQQKAGPLDYLNAGANLLGAVAPWGGGGSNGGNG
jgi:hypothetical protein